MHRELASERTVLFSYFIALISVGAVLLYLPSSWSGSGKLSFLDALFTSVSAVCVTGLISVDTALYSFSGKIIIMMLIQFGGLGIITFTTLFFVAPRDRKVSFRNIKMVKNYYLENIEYNANHILRNIFLLTIGMELTGFLILYAAFSRTGVENPGFQAIFHAVSAFCNAGFSLFSDSLEGMQDNPLILFTIAFLIIAGGLGFLVYQDLRAVLWTKSRKRFSLHTKIVLVSTVVLILAGMAGYYVLERQGVFADMDAGTKWIQIFFQSVTTRTAGFNTVPQGDLNGAARFFTLPLMFIGGSPGSIAGGIKTTTACILIIAMFRDINWRGKIRIGDRTIPSQTVTRAMFFFGKAIVLLMVSMFLLSVSELSGGGSEFDFSDIMFECFSAFATVGLSTGITGDLSAAGKLIIIMTMFAGRVGLISFSIPLFMEKQDTIDYPEEEVLIG